jgi:putative endonuclease
MLYIVYILQSEKDKSYYTGYTTNIKQRIKDHNSGCSKYSLTKKPYKLIWYCAFPNKKMAAK